MSLSLTFCLHFLLFDTYQTYHQQRFAKLFCAEVDLRNILHYRLKRQQNCQILKGIYMPILARVLKFSEILERSNHEIKRLMFP